MMGPAHRAGAAPFGVALAFSIPLDAGGLGDTLLARFAEVVVHVLIGSLVVGVAKWNDLDHPWLKRQKPYHFGAALVRTSARIGYSIRTSRDRHRADLHRGPSHCLEWCLLVAAGFGGLVALVPPLAPWAVWAGLAVFLGTGSHVLLDALTPSGVPLCATWNAIRYREVWRRHAFARKTTPVRVPLYWPTIATALVDQDDQEDDQAAKLGELVAWLAFPGVRSTTELDWAWRRVAVPLPRVVVMPVDESAPGCRPGLVTTDSAAEHGILLPVAYGLTATALLWGLGLLGPLASAMTS